MRRFHSDAPGQPRWLWEPAVHSAYGERCYFYLVAGRDPERRSTFTEELEALLDQINIESHLVHVVFGQYDALVRLWATEHARARFLRTLEQGRLEIFSFVEFASDEIYYSFHSGKQRPDDLLLSADQRVWVERAVRAEHSAMWDDEAEAAFANLKSDRLIFQVPPASGVKLYLFFSAGGTALAQPRDRVVDALSQVSTEAGLSQISIYSGVGFADFVLKGWCDEYDDILDAVNRVRRVAKDLRLAPWTLLTADGPSKASGETIDAVQAELPTVLEEFLRDAAVVGTERVRTLRRELASLPVGHQDAVVSEYRNARELLEPADLEHFVEIVAASLLSDRKLFNRSLSYLTSIEEDLRSVVPRALSSSMGRDWYSAAKSRGWIAPAPSPDELDGDQGLSLADLLMLLAAASEEIDDVRRVVEEFPSDWRERIRELLRLRNFFAHGSLWDIARARTFAGDWGERLPVIATSIGLQTVLEAWAQSTSSPDRRSE